MIELYDNFLPIHVFKEIQKIFMSEDFSWSWGNTVVNDNHVECDELDNHQFFHQVYHNLLTDSPYYKYTAPIVNALNSKALIKIKANLSVRTKERIIHGYHKDFPFECKTAIFYINSNDGVTMFKNGKVIDSVENRFIMFNSQLEHTGTTCTNQKRRIVINFNYF